jgi:predicted phage tail protein
MSTKLKTIKVYGSLAKFLGKKEFKADIASAADAMKFLLVNFPGLENNMKDQYYKVKVGDYDLEEKELVDPSGNQEIKIIPLVGGAIFGWIKDVFNSTVGKIIAGAVLIAAPYMAPAFFGGTIGTFGLTAPIAISSIMQTAGLMMALNGVSEMLTPVPENPSLAEQPQATNFSFNGVQNTSRAGTAIPLIFGEVFVGSVVVSAGIDTVQLKGDA